MKEQKDKRKFPRLSAYHLVKYKVLSDGGQSHPTVIAYVRNISAGGLCLLTEKNIPVSSMLQISINFPQLPYAINSLAKVSWSKKLTTSNQYELGVQFIDIEEFLRDVIKVRVETVLNKVKASEKDGR